MRMREVASTPACICANWVNSLSSRSISRVMRECQKLAHPSLITFVRIWGTK